MYEGAGVQICTVPAPIVHLTNLVFYMHVHLQTGFLRRRLEAELRAAEALGKVKQTIIEKRLAVELATIEEEHRKKKSGAGTCNFSQCERGEN